MIKTGYNIIFYILRTRDFQTGEFGESLENIKPLLGKLGQPTDRFKDLSSAVEWLNTSIEPFQIYMKHIETHPVDPSIEKLFPENFKILSTDQLKGFAITPAGQKLKRQILNHLYPEDTPYRRDLLKAMIFLSGIPFIMVILMRIIRPLVFVRFSRMYSMIGPCTGSMEIYLCEKDLGMHKRRIFDIYYVLPPIANHYLVKMWRRVVLMLPYRLASGILWLNRRIPGGEDDMVNGQFTSFELDVDCVLSKTKPHLSFTKDEERHGQEALRKMGISPGAPFVCFHTRDESYIQKMFLKNENHYNLFRNSNIENCGLAVKELVDRGYHCIRMGSVVQNKISFSSSNVIDYATNGMRSEFLDIYLPAKCRFFLGTHSGITYVPMIFRRPLAVVNSFPMGHAISWGKRDVLCFKKLWLVKEKRFLSFREILHSELAILYTPQRCQELGIEVIENTPEEICDVTQEMAARLDGSWETTEEYEELQRRFWSLYEYVPLRELVAKEVGRLGENARKNRSVGPFQALARVGSKFLIQNRGLLD